MDKVEKDRLAKRRWSRPWGIGPETHTKRQATLHGCLPSLLGDGDKGIETVYGEEKNILYLAD